MDDFLITPRTKPAAGVVILFTSRIGGVSDPPYHTLNLSFHIGDEESAVEENRLRLAERLPSPPRWLRQAHGVRVVHADEVETDKDVADASWTDKPGVVCAVQTADCMPVLFHSTDAKIVAAAHAGWRGLSSGILENTVAEMRRQTDAAIVAHIGPCISAPNYPVGGEVREALCVADEDKAAFTAAKEADKWHADLPALASLRLKRCGIPQVHIHGACTHGDATRFFSARRDGQTGRQAALIYLSPKD